MDSKRNKKEMPNKNKKHYINGVELIPDLTFIGWQPGFEYTKNLTFKNLNTKSIRLTYKVPATINFATLLPKTITLGPGTTFTLPITFRPLEKKSYDDFIEISQLEFQKTFKIPLCGRLPEFKVEIQGDLAMGVCSVNDLISSKIKLNNTSTLDTYFEWDAKEPFTVTPVSGQMKANSSIEVFIKFQPKAALVFDATAILKFGDMNFTDPNLFKILRLRAAGKYPHILIESAEGLHSECKLNFEKVLIGHSMTRYFNVVNMTEVKADFFVERDSQVPVFDISFNCLQHVGSLGPFEKQKIAITYSPVYPSYDTIYDYFNVFSSGRLSKNRVTCMATNDVPSVYIDTSVITFGCTVANNKLLKTFNLINTSDSKLSFQFETETEFSTFKFNVENGVLQPHERKLIQVTFLPQTALIYYKKVACIVQNHDFLHIEFIGTCHSELVKPHVIKPKHLNLYYHLKINNLLNNPPEQLVELNNQKKILAEVSLDSLLENNTLIFNVENTLEDYITDDVHSIRDRSKQKNTAEPCVTMSTGYVDFGATKLIEVSNDQNERSISLFNNTKGKLMIFWNSSSNVPFSVLPQECEIPPMKSYSFRVKFQPQAADKFYHCKLECYAMYKSLSNYTFVDERFTLPSWCLNVTCLGHTFHPQCETYHLPRYTLDSENIVFPVSIRDQSIYRTFTLQNESKDYPLIFDLQNLNNDLWHIKPHKGLIKKNEHQLFILKFTPKSDAYTIDKCEILLNYMKNHMLELPLVGAGLLPEVSLENNGVLYFPPTCKNTTAIQSHEIVNRTRSRIYFEWKIPYDSRKLFSVDEVSSFLEPYEKKVSVWKFTSEKIERFNHRITLLAWIDRTCQVPRIYNLRIIASCTSGSLQALEMYKNFGSVVVGSSVTSEITMINNNDCSLNFELFVKQVVEDSVQNRFVDNICVLEIEKLVGHVEARSRSQVRCRLRPIRLINYQFIIEYRIVYENEDEREKNEFLKSPDDENINESPRNQREILCYMTANGVYPKLNITDIKGLGSVSSLNKDYLWKLLSINELNSSMSCEPNPEELEYSIATRQEVNRRLAGQLKNRPVIEMNFNAAPMNSDDTQIMIFIENTGFVPADWSLLFPKDLMLELEYWAQTGDYSMNELEEMKIQDNKVFVIEPKRGHLEPGEIIRITITYRHIFIGQNKLPVLMKIAKGREILLNLVGTTVPINESFVYFPSSKFEFQPVEIGLTEYPIQVYEIYNGGDLPAKLEIDDSALDEFNQENYVSNILECLSKSELVIPPRSCIETKWKFSPLEAKTYQVDVMFKVNETSFNLITFKCIGYDKRKMKNLSIQLAYQDIPEKQKVLLPNQLASLTVDRILFGDVPLFSRERKVLFVKNNSSEHKISFTWHLTNPVHCKYVRILPSRGIIDVNQSKLCKLTFISIEKPAFYNIDLICEIKNETEMNAFRESLEQWRQEQKRQFQEFIIDEKELEERLSDNHNKEDANSKVNKSKQMISRLSVNQFKTIPPLIKNNLYAETNLARIRKARDEKKLWKKPMSHNPFLLHLNVIARTHYIDQFLEFSKSFKNSCEKYVDPLLGFGVKRSNKEDMANSFEDKIVCNEEESQALELLLAGLLRDLVNDKSFHVLIQRTKQDEIPYFMEYDQANGVNETKRENHSAEEAKLRDAKSKKKMGAIKKEDKNKNNTPKTKSSPIFCSLIENILENTLANIVTEAFHKEFSLTNRPRLIALPPKGVNPVQISPTRITSDQEVVSKAAAASKNFASSSLVSIESSTEN